MLWCFIWAIRVRCPIAAMERYQIVTRSVRRGQLGSTSGSTGSTFAPFDMNIDIFGGFGDSKQTPLCRSDSKLRPRLGGGWCANVQEQDLEVQHSKTANAFPWNIFNPFKRETPTQAPLYSAKSFQRNGKNHFKGTENIT